MRRVPTFLLLSLSLLPSCSGEKEGPSKIATVQGFCSEWAARACGKAVVDACNSTSADACVDSQREFCEGLIDADHYTAKSADKCLDAVEDAYSDAELTAEERDRVLQLAAPCDKILTGSGHEGSSCSSNADCNYEDDDLVCVKKAGLPSRCGIPTVKKAGQDCSAAGDVCEEGNWCDPGQHCVEAALVGQSCSNDKPCGANSRCDLGEGTTTTGVDGGAAEADAGSGSSSGSTDGTCVARKDSGDCESDDDCTSHICLPRANGTKGCAAKIPLSPSEPICEHFQ